jgi:hypothetical protein
VTEPNANGAPAFVDLLLNQTYGVALPEPPDPPPPPPPGNEEDQGA